MLMRCLRIIPEHFPILLPSLLSLVEELSLLKCWRNNPFILHTRFLKVIILYKTHFINLPVEGDTALIREGVFTQWIYDCATDRFPHFGARYGIKKRLAGWMGIPHHLSFQITKMFSYLFIGKINAFLVLWFQPIILELSWVVAPLPNREVILEWSVSFRPVFLSIVTNESQESAACII